MMGLIDSLGLRSENFAQMFANENYIIEVAKGVGVFNPKLWRETFKKPLSRSLIGAEILYTPTGLTIPLKRYNRSPTKQILDIAGLRGYDEKSKFLSEFLENHLSSFLECEISRIDVCFDFVKVPNRIIERLCQKRKPAKRWNTLYFKTAKERKSNAKLDIKIYNKQKEAKLSEPLERLEFCFKGAYFDKGMKLKNLNKKFLSKMEKTIKSFCGTSVKIDAKVPNK